MRTPSMWSLMLAYVLIIYSILFFLGVIQNAILLLMTFRSRRLCSMFNYLVAFSAAFQLASFMGIPVFVVSTSVSVSSSFSKIRVSALEMLTLSALCFYVSIPSALGAFASCATPFILTIDRVIAVSIPNEYKMLKFKETSYISFLVTFPLFYAVWIVFLAFLKLDDSRDQVVCLLPDEMGGSYVLFETTSISFCLLIVPLLLFVSHRMKSMHYDSSNVALFRALVAVTTVSYLGLMCSHLIVRFTSSLQTSEWFQLFRMIAVMLYYTMQCTVVPVYCYYVRDYRLALRELFGGPQDIRTAPTSRIMALHGTVMRNMIH